ncbi:MAG TPA: magnesium transporter [Candidatus Glassbacteria bacterium]|nr:magnesium transporter [Candidatus Glassbacteria bacterium]
MEYDIEKVRELISSGPEGQTLLAGMIEDTHPADLADIIERLSEEERKVLFELMPAEVASETLAETRDDHQEQIIKSLDDQTLQEVFEELSDDDATDIVQELSEFQADRVLRVIDREDREDIQTLLKYPEESAGGVMTSEVVAINIQLTALEAISEVRKQGREIEFYAVYVVDGRRKLCGIVSMRDLILADPSIQISEIMEEDVVTVPPEMDQEEVARLLARYNQVTIPVVDQSGRLLGRVTVDDVIDIMEEEVTEDLFRMSGVDEDESLEKVGIWHSMRSRLPWLCLNLSLQAISAHIIKLYITVLEREVILAMFMPVVAGIGGNTATQSLAVTLRRLILDATIKSRRRRILFNETLVAMMNGMAVSALVFILVYITQRNAQLGLIVAAATWLSMTLAGLIGALIPIGMKLFGFDPTVSSSVVSNITDILSFFLLLSLSALLLLS